MALSTRSGLAEVATNGDFIYEGTYNQLVYRLLADRQAVDLLGGEGLYSGGATVVGDLTTGGTEYPAFAAVVFDDAGNPWRLKASAATAITFVDTSGACTLYLVVKQQTDVSPASAVGGLTDFQLVAQLTASAAPAHSLALGAGSVTASAFTTWTPDTASWANGNTLLGPPVGGARLKGQKWTDGAGAIWLCTAAGTPGTWKQIAPGNSAVRASWDLGTAGNWNGGALLDGYLVYEPSAAMLWEYDTTTAKWLGERQVVAMPTGAGAGTHTFSGSTDWVVMVCPDQRYDWLVERWLVHGICSGTFDGTDQWDLLLKQYTGSFSTLHTKAVSANPAGYYTYAETIDALCASGLLVLSLSVAKTDTPPDLTVQCCSLTLRPVRQ